MTHQSNNERANTPDSKHEVAVATITHSLGHTGLSGVTLEFEPEIVARIQAAEASLELEKQALGISGDLTLAHTQDHDINM